MDELKIVDKANQFTNKVSLRNTAYINQYYKANMKESFVKFTGYDNENFYVKEWEVIQINFK